MRNTIRLLATALLIAGVTPAWSASGGLRYTITVSEFENQAGWYGGWNIGQGWGEVMTHLLNESDNFIVLGESDMRVEALREQDFAASGRTAGGAKAPVTGQMTPAQLLVKGAITHVQDKTTGGGGGIGYRGIRIGGSGGKAEVNATIYVVDSTTGQVLASTSVVGKAHRKGARIGYYNRGLGVSGGAYKNDNVGKAVEDAVAEAVDFITAQLPSISWTGSVALVKDGQVYVNRGSREGVGTGQVFVVGEVDVIRDPDTGEVLDESMNELARVRADEVKEKLSICSVISGDAGAIEKGMSIHLP